MKHDPILGFAPRRHDGRLGMHQWPAGYPVGYAPEDHEGDSDLCGDARRRSMRRAQRRGEVREDWAGALLTAGHQMSGRGTTLWM